ncbi:MAG: hypothetical protein IKF14_13080 [Atopobiaceae bacterium]|nr:hypothetical protein [Atopobiaceae bacterium]
MEEFNFTVDTRPMAESIRGVNHSVELVGGAVTAMQVAVIASERKAADKICDSIDSGFYLLLRSKLSQRIAQFASTMSSRAGSMMETASSIERTHQQMVEDFNRIKSRYVKVFEGLNRELEKRVRELDRPAMNLAHCRSEFLFERQCRDVPSTLYFTSDTAGVALKASNAHVKSRARESIEQLAIGSRQAAEYRRTTRDILEPAQPDAGMGDLPYEFVPVAYAVTENLAAPGSFSLEVTPPQGLEPETQATIVRGVRQHQDALVDTGDRELQAVRSLFVNKVSSAGMDERVARTMTGLFDASFGEASSVGAGGAQ